jgi:hypothetical protein
VKPPPMSITCRVGKCIRVATVVISTQHGRLHVCGTCSAALYERWPALATRAERVEIPAAVMTDSAEWRA